MRTYKKISEPPPRFEELITLLNNECHIITVKAAFLILYGGTEIEEQVKRIYECPICYDAFWARRLDAVCCGIKCTNIHSGRKYHEKNKEVINERRRIAYDKSK